MPGTSGLDLLRTLRAYAVDVPVVLITGSPNVETAMEAVDGERFRPLLEAERERIACQNRALRDWRRPLMHVCLGWENWNLMSDCCCSAAYTYGVSARSNFIGEMIELVRTNSIFELLASL